MAGKSKRKSRRLQQQKQAATTVERLNAANRREARRNALEAPTNEQWRNGCYKLIDGPQGTHAKNIAPPLDYYHAHRRLAAPHEDEHLNDDRYTAGDRIRCDFERSQSLGAVTVNLSGVGGTARRDAIVSRLARNIDIRDQVGEALAHLDEDERAIISQTVFHQQFCGRGNLDELRGALDSLAAFYTHGGGA